MNVIASKLVLMSGVIKQFLLSPNGDAEGFMLQDGTQVNFPVRFSHDLVGIVSKNDKVFIAGMYEKDYVFKAQKIQNVITSKMIEDVPPKFPANQKFPLETLQRLSASGKIQKQLFGPNGEVKGLILNDGTIIKVKPNLIKEMNIKTELGMIFKATGYGTKNLYGRVFEATEMSNL